MAKHTSNCISNAEQSAWENGAKTPEEAAEWARHYLEDGTSDCICHWYTR